MKFKPKIQIDILDSPIQGNVSRPRGVDTFAAVNKFITGNAMVVYNDNISGLYEFMKIIDIN